MILSGARPSEQAQRYACAGGQAEVHRYQRDDDVAWTPSADVAEATLDRPDRRASLQVPLHPDSPQRSPSPISNGPSTHCPRALRREVTPMRTRGSRLHWSDTKNSAECYANSLRVTTAMRARRRYMNAESSQRECGFADIRLDMQGAVQRATVLASSSNLPTLTTADEQLPVRHAHSHRRDGHWQGRHCLLGCDRPTRIEYRVRIVRAAPLTAVPQGRKLFCQCGVGRPHREAQLIAKARRQDPLANSGRLFLRVPPLTPTAISRTSRSGRGSLMIL
jgi:hypothetical protein